MRGLLYALGEKTLSGGREDAVRRAKNFYAHGEKFLCARKFISVRTKKYFRAHRNFLASYNAENEMCRSSRNEMREDGKTNCSGIFLNAKRAAKHFVASPLFFFMAIED